MQKSTLKLIASIFLCVVAGCASRSALTSTTAVNADQRQGEVPGGASVQQINNLLKSEFDDLFAVDDRIISPSYLNGDFNGDRVEDLAVAVRLNRQVDPNDRSKPAFQFEKAQGPGPTTAGESKRDEFAFTIGDLARYHNAPILVVIHGSVDHGVTHTETQQRFVIVDAWHLGKKKMSLFSGNLKSAAYGDEPEVVPPPHLLGNAILMIGPEESGTAVYWDGARYRWYEVSDAEK